MNIVCLIDTIGSGGAQRQLVLLATLLVKNGHKVEFVCYHSGNFYLPLLNENGVTVTQFTQGCKLTRIIKTLPLILAKKNDAIIAFLPMPSALVECLSFFTKARVIVSERSLGHANAGRFIKAQFQLHRFAHVVVTNSLAQKTWLAKKYPFLSDKIVSIINCVDLDHFRPSINIIEDNIFRIVGIGRIDQDKDPMLLLEAAHKLQETHSIQVDWYGHIGDQDYYQKLLERVNYLSANKYFRIHEPTTDIHRIYRDSNLVCLPTHIEGCSNVVCEAISSGKIVVTTPVGDNPSLVIDDYNGYIFNVGNLKQLINCIVNVISLSIDKNNSMENNSRQLAESLLSSKRFLKEYEALFR